MCYNVARNNECCLDWSYDPGPPKAGKFPAIYLEAIMKKLSIFADESGYFNSYYKISPYYIVTLLFHDQAIDLASNINRLKSSMERSGIKDHAIHTGPLIRRESDYENMNVEERKKIFNHIFNFTRTADISFETFVVEKKLISGRIGLNAQLSKQLSAFLASNLNFFTDFDTLIIYYDYAEKNTMPKNSYAA